MRFVSVGRDANTAQTQRKCGFTNLRAVFAGTNRANSGVVAARHACQRPYLCYDSRVM
ncbi:hypothetical protein PSP6_70030 [Paraburkholderia tropica]|nr:hypothetical protein PSP6_70030 [Paraburkholderia tropica]